MQYLNRNYYTYPGTWMFEALSSYYPAKEIIAGTYEGLQHISFENGEYVNKGRIKGINESLRFIIYDPNSTSLWASHPYRGIYRFKLSADNQKIVKTNIFSTKNGLPSSLSNYVARIKNRIIVATIDGLYEFDENKQKFTRSKSLGNIFGKAVYQYLNEDKYGNIWFVTKKNLGVVDFQHKKNRNKSYDIVYFPELNSEVVAGFENIYPYDQNNVFIGANKGTIHLNYLKYLKNIKPLKINLTQVKAYGDSDSLLFGGYFLHEGNISEQQINIEKIDISHKNNSVHFEFASPFFEQQNNIEYSYQLAGFDEKWSVWSSRSEKDYTNLSSGNYIFYVRARNNLGNESEPIQFKFSIKAAWYQSWWFYLLCCFGIAYITYQFILRQKKKHQKEQEYLKREHQLELEHNEKEIIKLRNEKLEAEVNFKNKELASTTMHLAQRGKLLYKIKEE